MNKQTLRSPMPLTWRIAVFLAAVIGAVIGFYATSQAVGRVDVITCLLVAIPSGGLAGGVVVVAWLVHRLTSRSADAEDED